jgi:hypothetical protein
MRQSGLGRRHLSRACPHGRLAHGAPWWRGWALTTVLALMVMVGPWLGKLHHIVHWQAADAQVHAASGYEHAFGQHSQVSDCLSFDQLCLGAQWPALAEAGLPELCPQAPAWPSVAAVPARPFAAFRARAPPDRLA